MKKLHASLHTNIGAVRILYYIITLRTTLVYLASSTAKNTLRIRKGIVFFNCPLIRAPRREFLLLAGFFENRSFVVNPALLCTRHREDRKLVNAFARFGLQTHEYRNNWFRHLSSEATRRSLVVKFFAFDRTLGSSAFDRLLRIFNFLRKICRKLVRFAAATLSAAFPVDRRWCSYAPPPMQCRL